MGATELHQFLNHLAVERRVAASIQPQALNAIVVLYDAVLGRHVGKMSEAGTASGTLFPSYSSAR